MLRSLNIVKSGFKTHLRLNPTNYRLLSSTGTRTIVNPIPKIKNSNLLIPAKNLHVQSAALCNRLDADSVDRSLLRLDSEIRKTGKINRREIEEVLEDIREMKQATSSQSLMIIRCCGELVPGETPENRTKLVKEVWKTMENLNVPIDISHYNALLKVYNENEYKFDPTEFLQQLSNKGIEPNRVTYQRLIFRYCQEGNIDGASTILQHMKDKQLPINEHVFNALIHGHAQANDMESAEGIIAVMKQAGLEASDDTFTTLMCGYAKNGDIQNIHRIVKECQAKDIFLIDRDFLNVIYTLASNGHDDAVDQIIPYLQKHSGFNQEAQISILRLVNAGKVDIAYKILELMPRSMRQEEQVPSGVFFLKQMIQSSTPSETIVKYSKIMTESGVHKYALHRACELALTAKNFEKAFDLLEALKETGFPMRQHYFWPFFVSSKTEKDVYDGLKCMMFLEVTPNTETLRDFIVPALFTANFKKEAFEATIEKLSGYTRIPFTQIIPSALQYILNKNDVQTAAKFALRYKLKFSNVSLRRALVDSYLKTGDAKSVARMLGSVGIDGDDIVRESVGAVLLQLVEQTRSSETSKYLIPLLNELVANGLGMSNSAAELIQNNLGENLTPQITNALEQLTQGDLVRVVENFGDVRRDEGHSQKSIEEMEQTLAEQKQIGQTNKGIQKMLLIHYCQDKNLEKAEQLKKEMQDEGFVFNLHLQKNLLDLYCSQNLLESASSVFNDMKSSQLELILDDLRILRYLGLLASNGQHEELLQVLKTQARDDNRVARGVIQNNLVWKILNVYAEAGRVNEVKEVFQGLVERGLTQVNNVVLGPLVKAYLVKDDLSGALTEFERCVKEHNATPWKQELFCRFIRAEDADNLQKVLDLSTSLYGEVNCLYDLVFAFLECGKIRQAKKILDTPGLRARNEKLESTCERYLEAGKVEEMEKLVEITKDVFGVDRNALYFYLLKSYCKQGDADKALSVWTSLQEENIQPSSELLVYLANFLRKNNKAVPFVTPDEGKSLSISTSQPATQERKKQNQSSGSHQQLVREFRQALQNNQVDRAVQIKQRLVSNGMTNFTIQDSTDLIDQMIQAERLTEAIRLTEEMTAKGQYPFGRVLRNLTTRLSVVGDVETLTRLKEQLPENALVLSRYNNRIAQALIVAGRELEYFEGYIKKPLEAGPDSKGKIASISTVGTVQLLEKKPELLPELEKLAEKQLEFGDCTLATAIWTDALAKKDFVRAKNIFDAQLKDRKRVITSVPSGIARNNKDLELARQIWNQVSASNVDPMAKGIVASCIVDIQKNDGDLQGALETVKATLENGLQLTDLRYNALAALKLALEQNNESFPYTISKRERSRRRHKKNDGSSSDSDSD